MNICIDKIKIIFPAFSNRKKRIDDEQKLFVEKKNVRNSGCEKNF